MHERRKRLEFLYASKVYGDCDYDNQYFSWFRVRRLPLSPGQWNRPYTQLLIELDGFYPELAPQWFHLEEGLRDHLGRTPDHYYQGKGHSEKGWAWFCLHLDKGWHPAPRIEDGDNLVTVIERIEMGLAHELG